MMKKSDSETLEHLKKEIEQWKEKYFRALADYQNLEKRVTVEKTENIKYAAKYLILKLLPVLDILEKLEAHLKDQGLTLVLKNLKDVLADEEVTKIEVLNKRFNPHEMECIEVITSDKEDEVVEEIRAGYKLGEKVIRVARVKVGKKQISN